ncbi:tyrosine-type recombinase/integrase [Kineococcus terrestris]|uniref:tyrosine-type recombinase/integrase n=1 Tax=Kineococcus terrestris TaxID=2044856 RepID=UPI0034DB40DC
MSGRSANGRSSIYLGADGRWHGRVSMGVKNDGSADRRHVTARTEKAVTAKVRELEKAREQGTVADSKRPPTVEQWLRHWLETIAARKVRASTLESYRSKIEARIVPALGKHRLDRLQPEHLESFYADCAAASLSSASVLQYHRILSRALKVAVQRGRVARNVCTLVDAPSLERKEVEPLTQEDARAILAAAQEHRNAARWSVALALGLRQGEALGLAWQDVDLAAGTLRVRQALQRVRGQGLVMVPPKSRAGRRVIALPAQLVDALRRHRRQQLEERMLLGDLWEDHDLVFAQITGRPIDPRADWGAWKRLLAQAGVRDARLHDARHTAATLLLQQGVPARVAMQILGHSQINLTLGTYSHVVPELATEAAARVGVALWGTTETRSETTLQDAP